MPVMFTKGDLFHDHELRAFAHGVSCAGAMDSGVALAFKKRWPAMFEDYRARCADKRVHLGDVVVWSDEQATVYSLAIQEHWKQKASLAALKRAAVKMVELAEIAGVERIGVPRIGTGMGGLDWQRAKSVLTDAGSKSKVGLIVFEQFVRSKAASES
ncbi:MAG: macro domain-containing protein [Polyangiaceae bacterium]